MGQQTLPPGFRFSPTDEELMLYYLRSKALGRIYHQATIADVDVYKFEPWDLPEKSALPSKDQEWYFFSAQDKKYSHTARINRTTRKGYWKATGKDRKVFSGSSIIGLKKTLIYYEGRAPNGRRTNWIMHEYRLDEEFEKKENVVCVAVLCRIRKKGGPGPRNGEQYGAPILNEYAELEEEANMGKVDNDTGCQEVVESKGGGNVFNLRDQVEVWKLTGQMGSSNVVLDHIGTGDKETVSKIASGCIDLENICDRKGTTDCDPELNAFFRSICADSANFDTTPDLYEHGGDTFPCYHQCLDTPNSATLFDLDTLPLLPTLLDADGHLLQDYVYPAFDESEILREMSDLINDGKGDVGSMGANGKMMLQEACDVPLDGDYIELDDMKAPLDGFALGQSIHSNELGRPGEQQLRFKADRKVETCKETQNLLNAQGSAARRARLQIPASKGRLQDTLTALPQVEKCLHGGDFSIPISRESYRKAGKQSHSGAVDPVHVVESSTTSYLSKHVATYAVSKHEMLPGQLCYASFSDGQDCVVTVNDPAASTTASAIKGKCNIDAGGLGKLPASLIDLPRSSRLLTKTSRNIDADALEKIPATPIYSSLSPGSPIKRISSEGSSRDVEVLSASQACNPKVEHANMSSLNRHSWKIPFRGLMSKAKQSVLGTRLIELENGMRGKFNDKLSALGKPAARLLRTGGNASPYDSLRQVVVATLCQLVAAVLIFFCLFWGFRVLVSYALSVSV